MTLKQYHSRLKNVRNKLSLQNNTGVKARAVMFELSGLKKFDEKNFQKMKRRDYTYNEVRKAMRKVESNHHKALKKYWEKLPDEKRKEIGSFRKFKRSNRNQKIDRFDELDMEQFYESV